MDIAKIPLAPDPTTETPVQKQALEKLHQAAQQFEGVFLNMLFKTMREGQAKTSLTGKVSDAEQTYGEMLDQNRADAMAKTGALGIGSILENQLRASVLANAASEANAKLPNEAADL
jgi:flagellar protein FlgJ